MASDPSVLLALAARAEAGGDATLSDDVWLEMGWRPWSRNVEVWTPPGGGPRQARPDLTHSIDAQAELPGRIREIETEPDGTISAGAVLNKVLCYGEARGEHAEERARLAAKLRAMAAAAQESDGG